MITTNKECKLIEIYFYICEKFEKDLKYCCQRYSNNNEPEFTDQEAMTIYLYIVHQEQRFKCKQIHRFANDYLRSWFPKLPSYAAFNYRINRLSEAFTNLISPLLAEFMPKDCSSEISLLDSLPIITCSGKRVGKVATELTDKGNCSKKGMYYYGVKLHALAYRRVGHLPFPEQLLVTPASESDLNVFKQAWSNIENRTFFGDKIYHNEDFFSQIASNQNAVMLTPVKAIKNQSEREKQFDKAANDLFSTAVSRIRQPIESLFNWFIEKTDFQRASKVRSTKGLIVHVFGKIAAAFIYLIFNS
ncbi:MAG: transposase [Bacteroidales bacterium]